MKHLMLAVPATLFMATAGIAQTDTSADVSGSGEFGTNWPLSVGATFLTDDSSATLRIPEELSRGWQSLSPEDQTMIRTDCMAFLATHGDAGSSEDTSASDSSAATTGTASQTATGTETDLGTATTDTTVTGDTATTGPAGYDFAEMKAICEAVGTL